MTSERQTGVLFPRFPTLLPFTFPLFSSNWITPLPPSATPSLGAGRLWFSIVLTYVRVYIEYPFLALATWPRRSLLDVDRPVRIILHDLGSPLMFAARTISAHSLNLLFSLLPLCLISLFVLLLISSGLLDFHSVRRG